MPWLSLFPPSCSSLICLVFFFLLLCAGCLIFPLFSYAHPRYRVGFDWEWWRTSLVFTPQTDRMYCTYAPPSLEPTNQPTDSQSDRQPDSQPAKFVHSNQRSQSVTAAQTRSGQIRATNAAIFPRKIDTRRAKQHDSVCRLQDRRGRQ
ncbi:hypothetical protein IWX90DRAFT_174933 [Phyllosticta citrichinensis]|uniref:Secreted protein n=1 Tax=Phyllosticta citrichinensis TaxID=1130410 RepID=A0ABR1XVD9_9PEZI